MDIEFEPTDPQGFDAHAPDESWEGHGPAPDALDLVLEVDALMSILAAQRYARIDAMRIAAREEARRFGRGVMEVAERSLRLELAAAMKVSEYAAQAMILTSEQLVHRYPAILDALAAARTTDRHAVLLADELDAVEPEFRDRLLAALLPVAEAQPLGTFRRALRLAVERVRGATLAERHTRALQSRRVSVEMAADGMAWLHLYSAAVEVRAIEHRVTAQAKAIIAAESAASAASADSGDEETHDGWIDGDRSRRTLDQARADVVSDLLIEGDTTLFPDGARGIRATVAVTVPALTLLATDGGPDIEPVVVEGVGPIPVDRARELCGGDAGWMRILTHPETGAVLSVGRDQYPPPAALRRIVKWRASRCLGPGCGMPASRCEIDHTIAWEDGGHTALDNLNPLCKGHHTIKHHGRWRVRQLPGGAMEWTSPAGRTYVVQPERRMPVFRPLAEPAPF